MIEDWLWAPLPDLAMVVISAIVIYVGVIVATRLTGLRSFAQFSSFDFAMSIAVGSLISTSLLMEDPPLLQGIVGLASIYGLQKLLAVMRERPGVAKLVDNTPTLLVHHGEIMEENLRKTAVTKQDLRSLLRRHNVCGLDEVRAVILETAGDVSVLHSADADRHVDPWLMQDVVGGDQFDED